jgi:putative glutamine amidotransferase
VASGAPAIGICAAIERVSWGSWLELETLVVPRTYALAVQRAGGIALVLPPDDSARDHREAWLDRLDGLLLAGGSDINPGAYGADVDPHTVNVWPDRDEFELALARGALERDMPILGICRGMQMLNVACGGTLHQHLPDQVGNTRHLEVPGIFNEHGVDLEPGSLAARASGTPSPTVSSHHHQGVDALGAGLVATGRAAGDDLVEAIEIPDRRYALGVLWHPEEDPDSPVIASLVEASG